jgi:hypothetical protein
MDEASKQLLDQVTPPLPLAPGHPAREDYEYVRGGTANLFIFCEPLRGWRHLTVTARRTRVDWAECIRELADRHYPDAEKIVLVMDNLNTHTPASLYEAFPPAEARRIAERLEIHYTPKHASSEEGLHIPLIVLTVLRSGKQSRLRFDPTVVLAGLIRRQWHDRVPFQIIECPEIGLG